MEARIEAELTLLGRQYTKVDFVEQGRWVMIAPVLIGVGWSMKEVPIAFQIPPGFPGTPPYGFYVPAGLTYNGHQPQSFQPQASGVPFSGAWSMFSWGHESGWRATADVVTGSNLFNWARSFALRFAEGA